MEKITGLLVKPEYGTIERVSIRKSLEGYYEALNCSCIDIVTRSIGGKNYEIVCDDEALCKEGAIVSAMSNKHEPMLFNRLFVAKSDGKEDLCSLSHDEICDIVTNHVRKVFSASRRGTWQILYNVDYPA